MSPRPYPGQPLILAALVAFPSRAQDRRQVVTNESCTVEVVAGGSGSPMGSLVITDLGGATEARMSAVGDRAILDARKYYAFTFSRKSALPFQGYDFWLKFSSRTSDCAYQCHILSRMTGDRIAIPDEDASWSFRKGSVGKNTDPNATLLAIQFP